MKATALNCKDAMFDVVRRSEERLVRPEGIEPPAYRFEACRSIHLSYGRLLILNWVID